MSIDERQSSRSPTTSRTDSYRDGPLARAAGRSPISEDEREDNEYEQPVYNSDEPPAADRPPARNEDPYISALRYRFPNRSKNDYVYSKPPGPSIPTAASSQPATRSTTTTAPPPAAPPASTTTTTANGGPYQSILRPATGGTNPANASEERPFLRPALRRVNPDEKNNYAKRVVNETVTPSQSKLTTPGGIVRVNEPTIDTNRPPPALTRQSEGLRTQESTFESVPSHGGPVNYLGIGTFSQFERCLQECLARERYETGIASQIIRHDMPPPNISIHDSVSVPPPQVFHSSSDHHFIDYPSRSSGIFSLDDIRHINVALSRGGISLFPHHGSYYDSYPSLTSFDTSIHNSYPSSYGGRHTTTGEIVSACRFVDEDQPSLYNRQRTNAVENVWNSLQHHQQLSYPDPSRSSVFNRGPYDI